MRRFTVKDFITYNNPCFGCESKIKFNIGFEDLESNNIGPSFIRPVVTGVYTEIDLEIKYNDSLKLCIFHKTNKIATNDAQALTKYLSRHKLFLCSTCDHCYTRIDSQFLNIHIPQGYVDAVGLAYERLVVKEENSIYQVTSSFIEEKTNLLVEKIDKTKLSSSVQLELPLMPKYKFGNRERFVEKIKMYLLFS